MCTYVCMCVCGLLYREREGQDIIIITCWLEADVGCTNIALADTCSWKKCNSLLLYPTVPDTPFKCNTCSMFY